MTSIDVGSYPLASTDYPFLTEAEQTFVQSFCETWGRPPMFYIALSYLRLEVDKKSQIVARMAGLQGRHEHIEELAEAFGLSRERVRQLSGMDLANGSPWPWVWSADRWAAYPFFDKPLLTADNVGWEQLCREEQLGDIDFFGALNILAKIRPLNIVALLADGAKATGRRWFEKGWQEPKVLFAYDKQYSAFRFTDALARVGHDASLQRVSERRQSLSALADAHFPAPPAEETRPQVIAMLADVLPMFDHVVVEGDDIVLQANRTNYAEEIYQMLQRRGEPMTVEELFAEFRRLHPTDRHTDSTFLRSYLWRDERFEAVGSKSTYQLCEWGRFAGALGELAIHLLEGCEAPVVADELCRQMLEQRPSTTLKSCATSIYLTVQDGRLLYYVDTATGNSCVGLSQQSYDGRYWPSPITVEGAVRSMRRFLSENQRWPFHSGGNGIESSLYYTVRKYSKQLHVTDDELRRYQEGMADIDADAYPANERDQTFAERHRIPTRAERPSLYTWYRSVCSQESQLTGCRRYYYEQLQAALRASCQSLDPLQPSTGFTSGAQLTLDFGDE